MQSFEQYLPSNNVLVTDKSWQDYDLPTLAGYLALTGFKLPGMSGKGNVEQIERLRVTHGLPTVPMRATILAHIGGLMKKGGKVATPFDAFTMVPRASEKYVIDNRTFTSVAEENITVTAVQGIVAGKDFAITGGATFPVNKQGDINVLAKVASAYVSVANNAANDHGPQIENVVNSKWTNKTLTTVAKDAVVKALNLKESKEDRDNEKANEKMSTSGNDLATKLSIAMKQQSQVGVWAISHALCESLPAPLKLITPYQINNCRGDKLHQMGTMRYNPPTIAVSKQLELGKISAGMKTQSEVWGGNSKGFVWNSYEMWDGVPLDRTMRGFVNVHYDLLHTDLLSLPILVIDTKDQNLAAYVQNQMPPQSVVIYQAATDSPKPTRREVIVKGGIFHVHSLTAAHVQSSVNLNLAVRTKPAVMENIGFYSPSFQPIGLQSSEIMRKSAVQQHSVRQQIVAGYIHYAYFAHILAVTYQVPPSELEMNNDKTKAAFEKMKRRAEEYDNLNYYLSPWSAAGFMTMISSERTAYRLNRETIISTSFILDQMSRLYHFSGYTVKDWDAMAKKFKRTNRVPNDAKNLEAGYKDVDITCFYPPLDIKVFKQGANLDSELYDLCTTDLHATLIGEVTREIEDAMQVQPVVAALGPVAARPVIAQPPIPRGVDNGRNIDDDEADFDVGAPPPADG